MKTLKPVRGRKCRYLEGCMIAAPRRSRRLACRALAHGHLYGTLIACPCACAYACAHAYVYAAGRCPRRRPRPPLQLPLRPRLRVCPRLRIRLRLRLRLHLRLGTATRAYVYAYAHACVSYKEHLNTNKRKQLRQHDSQIDSVVRGRIPLGALLTALLPVGARARRVPRGPTLVLVCFYSPRGGL